MYNTQWQHTLKEIKSTELAYFNCLKLCLSKYHDPFVEAASSAKPVLTTAEIQRIFGSLSTVTAVSAFLVRHYEHCGNEEVRLVHA